MKKFILIILTIIILLMMVGCYSDKTRYEYNIIVTKEPISQVTDSMKIMQNLLYRLDSNNKLFYIREGTLIVSNNNVPDIFEIYKTKKVLSYTLFKNFTHGDIIRLIELLKFLSKNNIGGIFQSSSPEIIKFAYKESLSWGRLKSLGSRYLIIDENDSLIHNEKFFNRGMILDHKGILYLIAYKDKYIY